MITKKLVNISLIPRYFHASICLIYTITALVFAEEDTTHTLDPIIVTAEKRHESMQNIAASISVLKKDVIEKSGIESIQDASLLIPNLHISNLTAKRNNFPFIRGIGSGQGDPAVTTFIDGVPQLSSNTSNIEFIDIERIEFLRGPQGTLYGRNTLGGAINIISTKPVASETHVSSSVKLGSYNFQKYQLSLNNPLIDDIAFLRFGGSFSRRDGYTENVALDEEVDDISTNFGRLNLHLIPSDNLDINISLFVEQNRDGDFVLFDTEQLENKPHQIRHDYDGFTDRDIGSTSIALNYYGSSTTFSSITGIEKWSAHEKTDLDFTTNDFLRRETKENQNQFYQEFSFRSPDSVDPSNTYPSPSPWIFGLSTFNSTFNHDSINDSRPGFVLLQRFFAPTLPATVNDLAEYEIDNYGFAFFGQNTYSILDNLHLTIGLRYEIERTKSGINLVRVDDTAATTQQFADVNEKFDELLPKLSLSYHPTKNMTYYGSVAKGFRAGGYNRNETLGGPFAFDEETSWSYELGIKSTSFDNRIIFNAAAFYINWNDMQLDVSNGSLTNPGFFLNNVGEAENVGVEFEFQGKLSNHWAITGGLGYVNAEFEDYIDPLTTRNVAGNKIPNVPDFTWSIGIQNNQALATDLNISSRLEFVGVGELFYDNVNSKSQNHYILTNFRIGISNKRWSLEGWIKNAFDQDYVPTAFSVPQLFSSSGFVGRGGDPRTLGFTLKIKI